MKTLGEILQLKTLTKEESNIQINSLAHNSKMCENNSLFFCIKGTNLNGEEYAFEAVKNGAVAVITQNKIENLSVPQIIVKDVRLTMARCAKNFYASLDKLKIIGVTGTNGKTTVTYMLKSVLENAGKVVGLIGTNEILINKKHFNAVLTTPDPIELHKTFYEMVKNNVEYVVMEVSAHAIALHKIEGINFEYGIFTNCTQDHLDFFKDILTYEQTKISFFNKKYCKYAVVNADSETGRIIARTTNIKNCATYGIDNPSNCFAINIYQNLSTSTFTVNAFDDVFNIKLNMGGEHNIYNALACIATAKLIGLESLDIVLGLKRFSCPSGRFNLIKNKLKATLILDFAHTPDAIRKMFEAVKPFKNNRIITVFGATGNRDKLKRPIMGNIIEEFSDLFYLTSDNPDNENPLDIANEVLEGVKNKEKVKIILDRAKCIEECIKDVKKDDIVLVLGKGTENYQIIDGIKQPYCDKEEIEKALKLRE